MNIQLYKCTLKPVIRGHHWDNEKVVFYYMAYLEFMNIFITGKQKCDLLIQVTG
jgi:hypothetical protein